MSVAAGVALAACAVPAVAAAEPTVDAAVAAVPGRSGSRRSRRCRAGACCPRAVLNATNNWGYRTYEQVNAEMDALAAANPSLVKVKTAARKSVEGRDIKYLEITNNVVVRLRRQAGVLPDGLDPRQRAGRG